MGVLGSFCWCVACCDFMLMFLTFDVLLGSCYACFGVITFTSLFGLNEGDNS